MESENFSRRGIQKEEVWTAADSLISEGLRPTIERVRQKIGRGSPNTVSPMLESWFATLASRLGVSKDHTETEGMPKALQEALKNAWEVAMSMAKEASALQIVQTQDDLSKAAVALSQRQGELDHMGSLQAVKIQALEKSVISAESAASDALTRLGEGLSLVTRREKEMQELQQRVIAIETAWDIDRCRNQEIITEHLQERKKFQDHAQSTQHRLLEEIDHARQETKKIANEVQTERKQFAAKNFLLEQKIQTHENENSKVQALNASLSADFHALKETFLSAELRSNEIQILLRSQLDESKNAFTRLTKAFSSHDATLVSGRKFPVSKLKRIGTIRKK